MDKTAQRMGNERIVSMVLSERRMGGNESFVRRKRSGGWEVTNRLYEEIGVNDGRYRSVCMVRSEKSL